MPTVSVPNFENEDLLSARLISFTTSNEHASVEYEPNTTTGTKYVNSNFNTSGCALTDSDVHGSNVVIRSPLHRNGSTPTMVTLQDRLLNGSPTDVLASTHSTGYVSGSCTPPPVHTLPGASGNFIPLHNHNGVPPYSALTSPCLSSKLNPGANVQQLLAYGNTRAKIFSDEKVHGEELTDTHDWMAVHSQLSTALESRECPLSLKRDPSASPDELPPAMFKDGDKSLAGACLKYLSLYELPTIIACAIIEFSLCSGTLLRFAQLIGGRPQYQQNKQNGEFTEHYCATSLLRNHLWPRMFTKSIINFITPEPLMASDVYDCICSLKRHRAPARDDLPPALFKDEGEVLSQRLSDLFACMWEKESIPDKWGESVIVPILKKKGAYPTYTLYYHQPIIEALSWPRRCATDAASCVIIPVLHPVSKPISPNTIRCKRQAVFELVGPHSHRYSQAEKETHYYYFIEYLRPFMTLSFFALSPLPADPPVMLHSD
ncbi:hypothetical protein T265_03188 [Opisthorchis viverrini]|uniref:Uncharacterized protein n=1 Tax=Opisthorchis viverrini TaxID=6198 RepID=A0A074ZSE0_OPIVI|nr:hypothetical protein T265_03188 [Opisthorchis viverrini]KER30343.1 hypothetical protein T265_03188 [Opisthorchis viverrini]